MVRIWFFTNLLNHLCRTAKEKLHLDLTCDDLSGKGIERAKNYLTKVAGIDTPFKSNLWQNIKLFSEVRNKIAHSGGIVDLNKDKDKKLYDTIIKFNNANNTSTHLKLEQSLEQENLRKIVLTHSFLKTYAAQSLELFLLKICTYEVSNCKTKNTMTKP
ncbi:hypothetical protein [Methylomonas sp. DH-1]|uniref:hypothetical protein n=1 Tax=Methylomonas sp. (strain DH-1) TaxID=1727196 RepID=UPI0012F6D189|nr:hypothetical protein [Methylomonas sp. DH-1]